ncbi:glycosyltransferase family 2 protein [Latilactobacillus sakei]|uniref:glycosyltransferase family 2 protein n=1 Tax=Latilactobacillus sakei TaxID=1599 RepID=UPI003F534803
MELSIILPVYNVELYVKECLESILNQTFSDFELIIIDDGSSDDTVEIIKSFKDKRIHYFYQMNSGISAARNNGIKHAKGKYIVFIDSDDIINSNLIEEGYSLITVENLDIVFWGFQKISVDQNDAKVVEEIREIKLKNILTSSEGLQSLYLDKIPHFPWANMIKRSIFTENNITFPVGRNYEDFATTYKLINYSKKIGILNVTDYLYRQRHTSIMHQAGYKEAANIFRTEQEIIEFATGKKDNNLSLAYNYVLRRLLDAWIYANNSVVDRELIAKISKEISRTYGLADQKYLSRKTKFKYYLFKLKLLKSVYRLKGGL